MRRIPYKTYTYPTDNTSSERHRVIGKRRLIRPKQSFFLTKVFYFTPSDVFTHTLGFL